MLDAYPLPRIDETVNAIAQYKVFSTIDLKSAYHQIPISENDKQYTAFEANNGLYQFRRVPFGVTNGVACFQRVMDEFLKVNQLKDTFAYLDNVTICGADKEQHDKNLEQFLNAAQARNLTFNKDKCTFATDKLKILGSIVCNGEIRVDPERFAALDNLQPPSTIKSQKRIVGLFSYYSQWIRDFSRKLKPLASNTTFPIVDEALSAFHSLRSDVKNSVLSFIDENQPFQVETDASDYALAATLNQNGRPVAFFSRSLSDHEIRYPSIEKEAAAIVEAIRKWRHYLTGRHFSILTDQQSVAYMFKTNHKGKIKNDKIMRWRIELSTYDFDIIYRPGCQNVSADALSRVCMSMSISKLREIHEDLCHPGVTRMAHFVKTRNLPFSINEIRKTTQSCQACAECKPSFYKPEPTRLIKATQAFERLNIDFKGPLPSAGQERYLLTILDEFSRFPFAFPCRDMSSQTVINCLCSLFSMFGMPSYVHSDRGTSFMSSELRSFLHSKGIATSRTTSYNPEGNGQVERLNGTLWKTITLALKTRSLPINCWKDVLPDCLHSIRSLLCTATNSTPHERMFSFTRKSTTGPSIPSWLASPGRVLLKRHVRASKYEPLVENVELIEANPCYAHIRYSNGHEDTVSVKHLAPCGQENEESSTPASDPLLMSEDTIEKQQSTDIANESTTSADEVPVASPSPSFDKPSSTMLEDTDCVTHRYPQRTHKKPDRLVDGH